MKTLTYRELEDSVIEELWMDFVEEYPPPGHTLGSPELELLKQSFMWGARFMLRRIIADNSQYRNEGKN